MLCIYFTRYKAKYFYCGLCRQFK